MFIKTIRVDFQLLLNKMESGRNFPWEQRTRKKVKVISVICSEKICDMKTDEREALPRITKGLKVGFLEQKLSRSEILEILKWNWHNVGCPGVSCVHISNMKFWWTCELCETDEEISRLTFSKLKIKHFNSLSQIHFAWEISSEVHKSKETVESRANVNRFSNNIRLILQF